ncbi:hypothetical protein NDU88_003627 [Pleurodeles waltl]|uniref:Uncharacterized protein n=1 Tax=Pleurodeles waltl TaxID=8319 RepID=A0AAV7MT01_PLEWA|nr:hypothetical protein NDU88_003627 [Pleurodeles waltl]
MLSPEAWGPVEDEFIECEAEWGLALHLAPILERGHIRAWRASTRGQCKLENMFCMNPLGGELWSVATGALEETGAGTRVLVSQVMVRRHCAAELRRGGASCAAPLIRGEGASLRAEERQVQLGPADRGSGVLRSARAVEAEPGPGGPRDRRWACGTRTSHQ